MVADSMVRTAQGLTVWTPAELILSEGSGATLTGTQPLEAAIVDSAAGRRTSLFGETLQFENSKYRGFLVIRADSGQTTNLNQYAAA